MRRVKLVNSYTYKVLVVKQDPADKAVGTYHSYHTPDNRTSIWK